MNLKGEKMLASSPDRFGFMIESTEKQLASDPDNESLKKLIEFYKECRVRDIKSANGMEYDLRTSEKIIKKCKESKQYSQNLYAALCNNNFIKDGKEWGCSWRHSGGIISNLREEGDYIDWYCSGIGAGDEYEDEEFGKRIIKEGFVNEGVVTEEIKKDIGELEWEIVIEKE
jgi:hypothetical protein